MESIHPRKSDFLPLKDKFAVFSLALLIVGGVGVVMTLSSLSGGGEGGSDGGREGGGGIGCSIPPIDTEVGGSNVDVEGVGCLVGKGAMDRVLGVVLKRPAESQGGLDMLD